MYQGDTNMSKWFEKALEVFTLKNVFYTDTKTEPMSAVSLWLMFVCALKKGLEGKKTQDYDR